MIINKDRCALSIRGTRDGNQVFYSNNFDRDKNTPGYAFKDIRGIVNSTGDNLIFYSFEQGDDYYCFTLYRSIRDWSGYGVSRGRPGYYGITLFLARDKYLAGEEIHQTLKSLDFAFKEDFVVSSPGADQYRIDKYQKEDYSRLDSIVNVVRLANEKGLPYKPDGQLGSLIYESEGSLVSLINDIVDTKYNGYNSIIMLAQQYLDDLKCNYSPAVPDTNLSRKSPPINIKAASDYELKSYLLRNFTSSHIPTIKRELEERSYRYAIDKNQKNYYNAYLSDYRNGDYTKEIKIRLERLIDSDFIKALKSNTEDGFHDFVDKWPDEKNYVKQIQDRLDELAKNRKPLIINGRKQVPHFNIPWKQILIVLAILFTAGGTATLVYKLVASKKDEQKYFDDVSKLKTRASEVKITETDIGNFHDSVDKLRNQIDKDGELKPEMKSLTLNQLDTINMGFRQRIVENIIAPFKFNELFDVKKTEDNLKIINLVKLDSLGSIAEKQKIKNIVQYLAISKWIAKAKQVKDGIDISVNCVRQMHKIMTTYNFLEKMPKRKYWNIMACRGRLVVTVNL